ncbi:hypothetical protein F5X96DRAFT_646628 [Biscogniauxia mediterranea]|nr:hypothetical protein F5X96DRAFT_646628 [Biscogniauxia mediterranea]
MRTFPVPSILEGRPFPLFFVMLGGFFFLIWIDLHSLSFSSSILGSWWATGGSMLLLMTRI